jgi:hypothetical protein
MKSHTLTWMHTRKNTPMKLQGNAGQLMVRVMMVRQVSPQSPDAGGQQTWLTINPIRSIILS